MASDQNISQILWIQDTHEDMLSSFESPDVFRLDPMMIDTFNRDAPGAEFVPGPLPKSSQIPPTAGFSGLLECPCSDRIQRAWNMTYVLQVAGPCETPVESQRECF